jgi:hypothetical protein
MIRFAIPALTLCSLLGCAPAAGKPPDRVALTVLLEGLADPDPVRRELYRQMLAEVGTHAPAGRIAPLREGDGERRFARLRDEATPRGVLEEIEAAEASEFRGVFEPVERDP